jgi:16S rRNA processing protein RimM
VQNKYISFGRITSAHGLKGEVNLECFFANYEYFIKNNLIFIKAEESGYENVICEARGTKNEKMIISLENINTKEKAQEFIGKELFIKREDLEEINDPLTEGHFVADLLGMIVKDVEKEEKYGILKDVVDFGGGVLLEVELDSRHEKNKNKKEKLEYFKKDKDTIKEVNLEEGFITIFINKDF